MENYIKEAKSNFSIDRIATGNFMANEMDLLIKLMASISTEGSSVIPRPSGYTMLARNFENRYVWQPLG